MRRATGASLLATMALATAACGNSSSSDSAAADAVRASGSNVSSCVPAWSGYGGTYDHWGSERAYNLGRWRCTLAAARDWDGVTSLPNQTEWCFHWYEGSDAEDLGFPAALEVLDERSC